MGDHFEERARNSRIRKKVGGHKVIGDEGETERTDRCRFNHGKFAMIMSNALAVAPREESHSR